MICQFREGEGRAGEMVLNVEITEKYVHVHKVDKIVEGCNQ